MAGGEQTRADRQLEDRLDVCGLHPHPLGELAEQRIAARGVAQRDLDGADLAPARVGPDATTQAMGEQLVAVADSEHRRAGEHGVCQPGGGSFAPRLAVIHHRRDR